MKKLLTCFIIMNFSLPFAYANPSELYNAAWKALGEKFYDAGMNHQDWSYWKNKYPDLKTKEDAYIAVKTMTESLDDPFTVFLEPSRYYIERQSMSGVFQNIGVYLKKAKNGYKVYPDKDSNAHKAGIKNGELVTKINGKSVIGASIDDITDIIYSPDINEIELTILKNKEERVYKISVEEEKTESIAYKPPFNNTKIPQNIKYLIISSFMNRNLAMQFKEMLDSSKDYDGFIIDLRSNPGGIAKNAAIMANMLLKDKIILTIENRDGSNKVIKANAYSLTDKPIVVLINGNSASASEIFAASMQDNKRAIIIGTQSYGKGIMQEVAALPDGCGMNITVVRYLTPSGKYIHKIGVTPDIEVKPKRTDYIFRNDRVLKKAIKILETEMSKNQENIAE